MKIAPLFVAAVGLGALPALAEGDGWSGAYGGVSMATSDGTHDYFEDRVFDDTYDLEGPSFGGHVGYMWASGNLAYGAELALTFGGVYEVTTDGETSYKDDYEYSRFIDLKGRVGYAAGDFLVYGALGVSQGRFESNIGSVDQVNTNTTGMLYGLGADYAIGDRYMVGAEMTRRDYDFFDEEQDVDIEAKIDTFTLRIGMKF